jgi:uncharacterized protein (TIGR02594 family)
MTADGSPTDEGPRDEGVREEIGRANQPETGEAVEVETRSEKSKPWWAIILVAALTGIGSQAAVTAFKVIGGQIDAAVPKLMHVSVLVIDKASNLPTSGAQVELRSADGQSIVGSGTTTVRGAAELNVRGPYGSYILELRYNYHDVKFARTDIVKLSDSFLAQRVDFDPASWGRVDTRGPSESAPTVALPSQPPAATHGPAWLATAYAELGTTATVSPGFNPRIVEYFSATSLKVQDDRVSWDSAFVGWVLRQHGVVGTGSGSSRSWLNWGHGINPPEPGCIAVFWLRAPDDLHGHVAFFISADEDHITVLGGNQIAHQGEMPSVSLAALPRSKFMGCREP